MKETRINLLAWHECQRPMQCDESMVFLLFGPGEQQR